MRAAPPLACCSLLLVHLGSLARSAAAAEPSCSAHDHSCSPHEDIGKLGGPVDAIVVGSGLAGMSATLSLLDRGARVVLVEKQAFLGGNSGKASSGINSAESGMADSFISDTTKSAAHLARPGLIEKLVADSAGAVQWLKDRVKVDLSMTVQLGGHSEKRTFRPSTGFVGAEVTFALGELLKDFATKKPNQFRILTKTKWTGLAHSNENWEARLSTNGTSTSLHAPSFVIASGGFGHDVFETDSLMKKHRPDLVGYPTTLGSQTTGDGVRLARDIGAHLVDMDSVQVHPTGFVDPAKPTERTKTLAAELLRGVGGLMLDSKGRRFTNELGTRKVVTADMLRLSDAGLSFANRSFPIVLNGKAAAKADRHVTLYTKKGLLTKVRKLQGLADHLGVPISNLEKAFSDYNEAAKDGEDSFGRTVFPEGHWPVEADEDFIVGHVTPVIHYTMGGVAIDVEGRVLSSSDKEPIAGLYAIGEASGGVHGDNRLGGNSLLECTVFGRHVGGSIPLHSGIDDAVLEDDVVTVDAAANITEPDAPVPVAQKEKREISSDELAEHDTEEKQTWITIYGQVYDLTHFLDEHPGGRDSLLEVAGTEATEIFESVHNQELLESMGFEPIGTFAE